MTTYYAMTTPYPTRHGWKIYGVGSTRTEAEEDAVSRLGDMAEAVAQHNIWRETELKNLTIKSATAAVREGYLHREWEPAEHPAWQEERED